MYTKGSLVKGDGIGFKLNEVEESESDEVQVIQDGIAGIEITATAVGSPTLQAAKANVLLKKAVGLL